MQQFLFPVSTVSSRNIWDPNRPFVSVLNMKKKKGLQIMSLTAYARETNKVKKNTSINVTCPML